MQRTDGSIELPFPLLPLHHCHVLTTCGCSSDFIVYDNEMTKHGTAQIGLIIRKTKWLRAEISVSEIRDYRWLLNFIQTLNSPWSIHPEAVWGSHVQSPLYRLWCDWKWTFYWERRHSYSSGDPRILRALPQEMETKTSLL